MPLLAPAPHYDVLHVLVAFTILLVAARGSTDLVSRFGQPPVVGEILAGLVLGPRLIAGIIPASGRWVVPEGPIAGTCSSLLASLASCFYSSSPASRLTWF